MRLLVAILCLLLASTHGVPVADLTPADSEPVETTVDLNSSNEPPVADELHTSHDAADTPQTVMATDAPTNPDMIGDEARLDSGTDSQESGIQSSTDVSEQPQPATTPQENTASAESTDKLEGNSLITYWDFPRGTDQGDQDLPRVRHPGLLDEQVNIQSGLTVMRSAEGTVKPITEHVQGQMLHTLRREEEAGTDAQDQYNKDPWAVYGGERGLFCRIQYYHDTVEFSPSCELVDYNLVDPEYHKPRFNCQFFEQRGILYFYGERWIDCTPLSQRGKKVVFECGEMCAKREGQTDV